MLRKLRTIYGDAGVKLDLVISILILGVLVAFKVVNFFPDLLSFTDATITFFGILIGFLITALSILLTFQPTTEHLIKLRESQEYKKILYSFLSTSFLLVVLVFVLFIFNNIGEFSLGKVWNLKLVLLWLLTFVTLRLLKSFFYLYAIIKLA